MGVYTNYKYEKWAPGLADKEEILVLTQHPIPVKDEEGNNIVNADGTYVTQFSRWELHSLLDEYEFKFTYNDEDGKEIKDLTKVNDLTEVNENFYISCGLSKEYPDGKKKVVKGIASFIQKKELFQKIDAVETEDNKVLTVLNEDGSTSYLWKYYGNSYEAYPGRDEKGEIIMSETDDKKPATFHTYIKLIDIILQTEYNNGKAPWYYKVSKEKEFYPIYQLQEDGSITSWAVDVMLQNLYFPDYGTNPNRLYTYIPHSQYNSFGVYDLTIEAEPEKRYIDYYKAGYEYYLKESNID
jgi:hypothetical protein